ncbi:NAD(P)/FAD-dependent oxidoreductase [Devosia sp.]|uniref:NAD(P)/FAD-dependent oxidoreductase n=1 Tax=Devosia sp. TaxID=1871048 RepID=UPI002EEA670C
MLIEDLGGGPQLPRTIAVVGSGIAGLAAAWLLSRRHRVTLYEEAARPGGHSNTVTVEGPRGPVAVDTGFIVYNERNYPNLTALLAHLEVPSDASDMSFAASLDGGRVEYSSGGLAGLIGHPGNLVRPGYWLMLRDIVRFYREAPQAVVVEGETLGAYLDANGYTPSFIEEHLLPMGAAIWSTTAREMRAYPFASFVRFFASHGLLELVNRPKWRTVRGGSRSYVAAMLRDIAEVQLATPVGAIVRRPSGGVEIFDRLGRGRVFDNVVIAAHADQALAMLADPDADERRLLGAFAYTDNLAVLHSDPALMPRRRHVWASWNYIGQRDSDEDRQLCVTYWMNRLQNLDPSQELFVTLNPTRPVAAGRLHQAIGYTHPLFDQKAIAAQQQLWRLQGRRNTWFAGSYFGHGFHEDALQAGLAAAELAGGVRRPWTVAGESDRITLTPLLEAAA